MGWGKAEKLLALFNERFEEINRKEDDLEDFDDEIYEELKSGWNDLSHFMKVSFLFSLSSPFFPHLSFLSYLGHRSSPTTGPQERKIRIFCQVFWSWGS